jgi:putative oxidoreductase
MMISEQRIAVVDGLPSLGHIVDKPNRLVQAIAVPSIAQLMLRVALAVPFWPSCPDQARSCFRSC